MNVTIELDEHEARALAASAGTIMAIMGGEVHASIPMPDTYKVFPLESAQMKLEVAMRVEGIEL